MGYIIKVESESKQALAFLDYAKKLGFKVTKEKKSLRKTVVLAEDELTYEDRKFIATLSKKTNKAVREKWDKHFKAFSQ